MLKAAAVNMDKVRPDEAALGGKTRRQAQALLRTGGGKRQRRRRMFVWAASFKESFCKKPQLKQGRLRSGKWFIFEKSVVSGGLS